MNAAKQPVRTQVVWPARHPIAPSAQGTPWGSPAWGTGFRWPTTSPPLVHVRRMSGRTGVTGLGQNGSSSDLPPEYTGTGTPTQPTVFGVPTSTAPPTGINWTQILAPLAQAGANIGTMFAKYANPIYNLAPGTYYQQTPTGTVIATAGAPTPTSTALSGYMPYILIGGGLLLLVMVAKR